jgi:cell division protein FtsW
MLDRTSFSRADSSLLSQWWWTVDRVALLILGIIMVIGIILSMAASPSVANHIGLPSFYFVKRHMVMLPVAVVVIVVISLMDQKTIRQFSLGLFFVSIALMVATFFWGVEIKGAKRWINAFGLSLQPSELVKPALAVVAAWFFCLQKQHREFPGYGLAGGFFLAALVLLAMQPDMGMIVVLVAFGLVQLFMTGISLFWVWIIGAMGVGGFILAYFSLAHVAKRIDRFLDPSTGDPYGDRYQINRSLEAFVNGGLTGQGPGEGVVKKFIPDVHADFIFAVAGEEFGLFFCWLVVGVFAAFIMRCLIRAWQQQNLFRMIAVTGLVTQFGLQAIVNLSSTLRLMPTKGMTLPFISYGGSSLLASAITVGLILAFTRKQVA